METIHRVFKQNILNRDSVLQYPSQPSHSFISQHHIYTSWQTMLPGYQAVILLLPFEKIKQKQNIFEGQTPASFPDSCFLSLVCKLDMAMNIYI